MFKKIIPTPIPIKGFACMSLKTTMAKAAWTIANPAILMYENMFARKEMKVSSTKPVSYTHLTLPTILLV